ncbi:MAG: DUF309 domain-containing protein [Pseudomonadota bacterium]
MVEKDDHVPWPDHAYVPGFSPRHSPEFFDEIKMTVPPDLPADQLHSTIAFRAGKQYFDAGFYWECHEVLEVIWRQTRDPSPEREMVLALIQLANARLKVLMRQPRAAMRLCDIVDTRISRCPDDRAILGLRTAELRGLISEARAVAKKAIQRP